MHPMCLGRVRSAGFAAVVLAVGGAMAEAETVNCTAITSVPYVITTGGVYCLTGDLSTAMAVGNAIEIDTNNVVLDLNGHKIGGLSAGLGTSAIGVYAVNRQNVTIKNGTIRGFYTAIVLLGVSPYTLSQGHVIEDVRVDQNTFYGMQLEGRGILARRNQVVATGGTTTLGPNANATGIFLRGPDNRAIDNSVVTVTAQGTGLARGIDLSADTTHALAVGNRVEQCETGILLEGTSKYRDNLTAGVTTPFLGGIDAGNNN